MTLSLKKIELFNFRCHSHFVFEPDLDGITSIMGQNGVGKSTIVDAFAWALYGIKPNKVNNKMLIKEGVDVKKHETKVIVIVEINKIEYEVVRKIVSQSGASECNVYGKSSDGTYNILAGPAVTSAEAYIKQIMGMDDKGFLTSILIQQKQVDQIVSSSPKERAAVIEKLTGISSITEAIDMAHSEMKAYQKAASVITVKDSKTIRDEIDNVISEAKEIKNKLINYKNSIKKDKNKIINYSDTLQTNINDYNSVEELNNKNALLKQHKKMLNDESSRIVKDLSKFKKEHSSSMIVSDPKPLKEAHDKTLSSYLQTKNDVQFYNNKIDKINKELADNKDFIDNNSDLKSQQEKLINDLNKVKQEIEDYTDKHQIALSNKKQTKKALSTISSGDMVCPVCKRPIDNPEDLKNELNRELDKVIDTEKEIKKQLNTAKEKKTTIDSKIEENNDNQVKLNKLLALKDSITQYKESLDTNNSKMIELKSRVNLLSKDYDKAMKEYLYKEDIDNKKNRLQEINSELVKLNKDEETIEQQLSSIPALKKSEINKKKRFVDDKKKEYNELLITFNNNKSHYQYLKKRYTDLREQYNDAVLAQKKYNKLISKMKLSAVTGTVMSDFKVDRIKFAVPTIEMYASTILSQFTDSKFTQLKLDGKFNTSVITSTGNERPIAKLSGGELSAVAIALRLSISMLLNGADKNVIIFDEVLVSMDKVRARKIMETISTITNSQIIFIAHNSDINSIADLVVPVGEDKNENEE